MTRPFTSEFADGESTMLTLMNAIVDGVFVAQDHRFVYANPALPAMLGYTGDAFIGLPFDRVVVADRLAVWTERYELRIGDGDEPSRSYETAFLRRDGEPIEFELLANRTRFRGRPAVLGVVRDLTERKQVLAELQRHRDHLEEMVQERTRDLDEAVQARLRTESFAQKITDNLPGRIAYWDLDCRCRFVNNIYCDWFGRSRDELLGRTIEEIFGPQTAGLRLDRVRAALAGRPQTFERDEVSHDGRQATTLVHYVPDLHEGRVAGFFVLASDISESRRASLRLEALNAELVLARNKAESAVRAKSSFLANMSHEIRTPMNAIIGLTYLLQREAAPGLDRERLGRIGDAAQHLLHIVNEILDLSKIEAGKLELEVVDFDLDEVLARCCSMVAEPARAKGLEIVVHADGLPPRLRGDPTRLAQALVNLLGNAVKFTEHGVISLRCYPQAGTSGEPLVRFDVRDTGMGIAPQRLGQLFNAFEQADSSTTRRFGGTGLGLAITRHLAQLMGGDAGADSELGVGSTFWLSAALQAAENPSDDGTPYSGMRVLLVDDLPEARESMADRLERFGLRVDTAESGAVAIGLTAAARGRGEGYDLMIVDWMMPEMDGLETARRLLALCGEPAPQMIMVSAASGDTLRREASALGIECVLEKPVSPSTLHEQLLNLLIRRGTDPTPVALQPLAEASLGPNYRGARVLLAEDNLVNQEVAGSLLRIAGFEVDIADNGARAVEMAHRGGYDLILMDMQMPEMDGPQATREIRKQPALARVPIIAMTANAFEDDRAACLAAGMNDHIAKPVNPRAMYATLARWLEPRAQPAPAPRPVGVEALEGIEGLDVGCGLMMFAGHADVYQRALEQFVQLYGNGLATLAATRAGTPLAADALEREAHSLGGACVALGASALGEQAQALEATLRRRRAAVAAGEGAGEPATEAMGAAAQALAQALERLVAVLRRGLARMEPLPRAGG